VSSGEKAFSNDGSVLFCKLCEIRVSADQIYIVTQHVKTDKHLSPSNRHQNATTSKVQQQHALYPRKSMFFENLCN